jgi:hypothetical protein
MKYRVYGLRNFYLIEFGFLRFLPDDRTQTGTSAKHQPKTQGPILLPWSLDIKI